MRRNREHPFAEALAARGKNAVRANLAMQNYGAVPRHWYVDAFLKCVRCGHDFTWTAQEQKTWFEVYSFSIWSQPRHCRTCRQELRHLAALRREYDSTVAAARNHGTLEQKSRIVEIVAELQQALGGLPERMVDTMELFRSQIAKRADQDRPPDAVPPHRRDE